MIRKLLLRLKKKIKMLQLTKKAMEITRGPICNLCSGRKTIRLNGKDFCPNCEQQIIEAELARGF